MSGPGVIIRPLSVIRKPAGLTIQATSLFFTGSQGVALTPQTLTPSGGIAPYSFASVDLPAGVTVGAATGIVSGTPTVSGNVSSTVTITDSAAQTKNVPVFFALLQTAFTDDFTTDAARNGLGPNWLTSQLGNPNAGTNWQYPLPDIGNTLAAQMTMVDLGEVNPTTVWRVLWTPAFTYQGLYTSAIAQRFVQAKLGTTLLGDVGIGFFNNDTAFTTGAYPSGYWLDLSNAGTRVATLYRVLAGVTTSLVATAVTTATDDVWRLSIENQGTQVACIISKNGVQVGSTFNDTNANRINYGAPCIMWFGIGATGGTGASDWQLKNFSCGVGA